MKLPELLLKEIIDAGLAYVRTEISEKVSEQDTILYYLFGEEQNQGGKDLYTQAKELFTRKEDSEKKIEVKLFFDKVRNTLPTIHITSPAEMSGIVDGIGIDEGEQDYVLSQDGREQYPVYSRSFSANYNLIITGQSVTEILIIYNTLRSFLISVLDSFELNGLQNIKLSGGDLNLNESIIPNGYVKYIGISFFHEVVAKRWFSNPVITNLVFTGTPVDFSNQIIDESSSEESVSDDHLYGLIKDKRTGELIGRVLPGKSFYISRFSIIRQVLGNQTQTLTQDL